MEVGLLRQRLHTTQASLSDAQAQLAEANATVRSHTAALAAREAELSQLRLPSAPAEPSASAPPAPSGASSEAGTSLQPQQQQPLLQPPLPSVPSYRCVALPGVPAELEAHLPSRGGPVAWLLLGFPLAACRSRQDKAA